MQKDTSGSNDEARSKWRWTAEVDSARDLTWGRVIDGAGIVAALDRHGLLGTTGGEPPTILEIGPGYGRLLSAIDAAKTPCLYTGLEVNATRARELARKYPGARWLQADITLPGVLETAPKFDLVASFLTFKHLYPDFGAAAANCRAALKPGGALAFDLRETQTANNAEFDAAECFVRRYARAEAEQILTHAGFTRIEYGFVDHDDEHRRLLVIARP